MHLFTTVLAALLPLFGLVAIGYAAKKARILHVTDAEVLNRFVVDISLPAFIIDAFLHNKVPALYLTLPVLIWVSNIVVFSLAFVIARLMRLGPKATGTMLMVSTFGNTGFLGYPMTNALHPELITANVIMDQIGMSLFVYPVGVFLGSMFGRASGQSLRQSMGRMAKSPIMISLLVGLLLRVIPLPAMPPHGPSGFYAIVAHGLHALIAAIHLAGTSTIPVVLVAIGILLRPSALREHLGKVAVIGVLRLMVAPAVGFLVARHVLGIHDPALTTICVLISGTPPSAVATVLCGQYDMDGSLGVAAFFALTFLSALTIPLMLSICR